MIIIIIIITIHIGDFRLLTSYRQPGQTQDSIISRNSSMISTLHYKLPVISMKGQTSGPKKKTVKFASQSNNFVISSNVNFPIFECGLLALT